MHTDIMTAEVAGMTLRFRCHGTPLDFSRLCLFAKEGAGDDVVDIDVRHADSAPTGATTVFTAQKERTEETEETDWDLLRDDRTGEEIILQRSGALHDVRAASIRFTDHKATLSISTISREPAALPLPYPLFNIFLSRLLQARHGYLIHSSAVKDSDGRGYLFTAPSGTGKSTIAGIFASEGAAIINDDTIAIRLSADGRPTAHAIPMAFYDQRPLSTPLSALFALSQSPTDSITRLGHGEAVVKIMRNVIHQPYSKSSALAAAENVIASLASTPAYDLAFKPDAEVVGLVRTSLRPYEE